MTNEKFNLVDDPWIPIAGHSLQSLKSIFENQEFKRIGGTPIDKIVILRLLISITHAAIKIPNTDAWINLSTTQISQKVLDYLSQHHDQFNLYGDKPFFQFPQLNDSNAKSMTLDDFNFTISTGNNTVLSQWNTPPKNAQKEAINYDDAYKACFIISSLGYIKNTNFTPVGGKGKGSTGETSLLLGNVGRQHCFVLGDSLLETIKNNLLTDEEIKETQHYSNGIGTPFWELDPTQLPSKYKQTYLGRLLPINKKIHLTNNNIIYIQDGLGYTLKDEKEWFDPALIYREGLIPLNLMENMRLWRELPSILNFLNNENLKNPYFLTKFRSKTKNLKDEIIQIFTAGVAVSNDMGEQKIKGKRDYMYSEFSFPKKYLGKENYDNFKKAVDKLNGYAMHLYRQTKKYAVAINLEEQKSTNSDLGEKASTWFWEMMEPHAQEIIDCTFVENNEKDKDKIAQIFRRYWGYIETLYDQACPHETPRQIRAWILSRPSLELLVQNTGAPSKTAAKKEPKAKKKTGNIVDPKNPNELNLFS